MTVVPTTAPRLQKTPGKKRDKLSRFKLIKINQFLWKPPIYAAVS
jgi:hypothetical protein